MTDLPPSEFTPEALNFRCTGCGACCSEFWINVTDTDVRRLVQHTGMGAMELVEFASPRVVESEPEEDGWVPFGADTNERGLMTLKTDEETSVCQFLQDDGLCGVYEARPLACRLYPWDRDYPTAHTSRIGIEIFTEECPYESDGSNNKEALEALFDQDDEEREAYEARIETWRRLGAPDDPILFLRFLRLPLGSSTPSVNPGAAPTDPEPARTSPESASPPAAQPAPGG